MKLMKRIVMIVGGKGGTGKTALTRLEVDELHTQGIKYIATMRIQKIQSCTNIIKVLVMGCGC